MIVAEQKPLDEIKEMLSPYDKVLVMGCGTCVTVCFSGGTKEASVLASMLRMSARLDGAPKQVDEVTVQRQCEWEYLDTVKDQVAAYDAVLSLGCGIGVQAIAEHFKATHVLPGQNTAFLGLPTEQGVWEERCAACGDCILDVTGGICPIARCAKQLLNGPCGGSQAGECEIDPDVPCVWQLIWERATELGQVERLLEVQPAKDWKTSRDGGPRKIVREDLRQVSLDLDEHL
ncbi:MAG: methylenetetrahydrofolate reductase C-terminal domain-containing protein [Chloroflexota bacterium]|nr:methylenetetrahydrofolate reductase C-terminal domain-containing protein [Chloroflexota bacterium]